MQVTGLTAGKQYQIALYSFDNASANVTTWTDIAPSSAGSPNGIFGWWNVGANNNIFAQPVDEQTINWRDGAMASTLRAPALFTLTADGNGSIEVWGWGGDGAVNQNASNSYLNGIQIAAVPEPATLALLGLAAPALWWAARKRK